MPKELYFFELPIYRTNREKFDKEVNEYIDKEFSKLNSCSKKLFEKNPTKKLTREHQDREAYGNIWEYNDIIGYIKLYFYGTQVRGEYWSVKALRIVKTKKKDFICKDWSFGPAISIHFENDSVGIYNKIIELINSLKKLLKSRFIDTSKFDVIGPYIDWKQVYDEYRSALTHT
ncbi:MAG: hypothetical protein GY730_06120 [bacterium]|nr:hypothetical protein [bacterium]